MAHKDNQKPMHTQLSFYNKSFKMFWTRRQNTRSVHVIPNFYSRFLNVSYQGQIPEKYNLKVSLF